MKQSDNIRLMWLDKQIVTVYGPYPCYDKWMVRAWAVVGLIFVALLGWCS